MYVANQLQMKQFWKNQLTNSDWEVYVAFVDVVNILTAFGKENEHLNELFFR